MTRADDVKAVAPSAASAGTSELPERAGDGVTSLVSAALFLIPELKRLDGPTVHAAITALHAILKGVVGEAFPGSPGVRVLSSVTGAVVLVPDTLNRNLHDLLQPWLTALDASGIAVHVGVTHGPVESVKDADGTLNAIGRCINVAARVATSDENTGVLVEESYADHVSDNLPDTHWLHPQARRPVAVKGKRKEEFRCYAPPAAPPRTKCEIKKDAPPSFVNAVLIAYDLPDFSEGDLRTLASRFRSVVQEVRKLRNNGEIPETASVSFSPGGDGGVLALTNIQPTRAFGIAEALMHLLEVESGLKSEVAGVRARIGLHYGEANYYENAEGVVRPTGLAVFAADDLAGDKEARRYESLVVSDALINTAALGSQHYQAALFREIGPLVTAQGKTIRRYVRKEAVARALVTRLASEQVEIARLPVTGPYLFGRDGDLTRLDECWVDPSVHVVSLVAWGGTGKSALVDAWLQRMEKDGWRGAERVFGWSFYSQGSSNTASADMFIDVALRWFGDKEPMAGSPWDKGARLAGLVKQHRALLVLDGVEPLQAPPGQEEGKIRDPGLGALLRELARGGKGLCVITTRIAVADLASREGGAAPRVNLDELSPEAGAQLLAALGAKGSTDELKTAAGEVMGHALTLTLLGSLLVDAYEGDILRRKEIVSLEGDVKKGEQAKRVMERYARWFGDGPEVAVLELLGLFDRPADAGSIAALRAPPAVPGLTDRIVGISEVAWRQTLTKLRRANLVAKASKDDTGTIDAHPLVREHFGARLKARSPDAWRAGHGRLFEHLQKAAPEFPETAEAMAPIYAAVVHGCQADRRQEALDEVYVKRVTRREGFNVVKLGAFGPELAMLAGFFDQPWSRVAPGLTEAAQSFVLRQAGFALRALGRLADAGEPMELSLQKSRAEQHWSTAALLECNLSQLHLARGAPQDAMAAAQRAIDLAERSEDWWPHVAAHVALADALHQAGYPDAARSLFESAETLQLQKERQPMNALLYSAAGFQYCDLLLTQGQFENVLDRATQTLAWATQGQWLWEMGIDYLSLGRAYLRIAVRTGSDDLQRARSELNKAITGLRKAGQQDYVPLGLLARAELFIHLRDFAAAEGDLDEALTIVTRGGMRLHEADAHLSYARLHVARGDRVKAAESLEHAKEMIEEMGYGRRRGEVAELESAITAMR